MQTFNFQTNIIRRLITSFEGIDVVSAMTPHKMAKEKRWIKKTAAKTKINRNVLTQYYE